MSILFLLFFLLFLLISQCETPYGPYYQSMLDLKGLKIGLQNGSEFRKKIRTQHVSACGKYSKIPDIMVIHVIHGRLCLLTILVVTAL